MPAPFYVLNVFCPPIQTNKKDLRRRALRLLSADKDG